MQLSAWLFIFWLLQFNSAFRNALDPWIVRKHAPLHQRYGIDQRNDDKSVVVCMKSAICQCDVGCESDAVFPLLCVRTKLRWIKFEHEAMSIHFRSRNFINILLYNCDCICTIVASVLRSAVMPTDSTEVIHAHSVGWQRIPK